jgi:ceramide glucosyltransferase
MIAVITGVVVVLAGIGVVQALVAARLVAAFAAKPAATPSARPPVTVLKPLHGNETSLEAALTTLFLQDYPDWQMVFGVQDQDDPAIGVVRRLQARFPDRDVALVVDPALHGMNRKVGNLINMLPQARHDVLVIADSDVHVRPDYLDRLMAALQQPNVGLVTTLYAGLPVTDADQSAVLTTRLGATQITHGFLPAALLARATGRQDCLGATMCLRRQDLTRIGGFRALVDHLADDNVLGQLIAALGRAVVLAQTVVLTTVPETRFTALFHHELRWARTIRALAPWGFFASILQYPLAWGLLLMLLAKGALWSIGLFLIAWVLRAVAALSVDRALDQVWSTDDTPNHAPALDQGPDQAALAFSCPVWLLPLRDVLSVIVLLASYGGRHVIWRGHGLQADTPPPLTRPTMTRRPLEGINTR